MSAKVFHSELWGKRESKYSRLLDTDVTNTDWAELSPASPFYMFRPENADVLAEYNIGWYLPEIMPVNVLGFQTHRDHLAVAFDQETLRARIESLRSHHLTDEEIRTRFALRDTNGWRLSQAREQLRADPNWADKLLTCAYRPLDPRWCFFSDIIVDRPRRELLDHVAGKNNLCLGVGKQGQAVGTPWQVVTVAREPLDANVFRRGGVQVFPLYLHGLIMSERASSLKAKGGPTPNLNTAFVGELEGRLGLKFIPEGTGTLCTAAPQGESVSGASRPPNSGCTAAPQGESVSGASRPPDSGCTAAVSAAVSGASRPRFGEVLIRDRGRLPHWEAQGAVYFVTFRLADSLPRPLLDAYTSERNDILATARKLGRELSPHERKRLAELFSERIESALDTGTGACLLSDPNIAATVAQALRHFDGQRYRLFAWCVMPNHVHVVFKPLSNHTLADIVHAWKSYTAKQVNSALRREGAFWQREYYDHLVRDEAEFHRIVEYVAENPGKAGLRDWKWLWVWGQDAPTTASETLAVQEQCCATDADPTRPSESNAAPHRGSPAGVSGSGDPACTAAVPAAVSGASRPRQAEDDGDADKPQAPGQPSGTFGPQDIFHYIYAIFHSRTYRKRYGEFLKRDFPRVPLTGKLEVFRELCRRGADLVALHLTESDYPSASWNRACPSQLSPFHCPISRFPVRGDDVVEKVSYVAPGEPEPGTGKPLPEGAGRVYISIYRPKEGEKGQYFEGIPPQVWQFHVGGYQVCEKWLKDRKGRKLSYNDIQHYHKIVVALNETIRLMSEIDRAVEAHGGWPIR